MSGKIDWNDAGRFGLIERINTEVLHPIGLAMYRVVETGESPGLLVADDGVWEYAKGDPGNAASLRADAERYRWIKANARLEGRDGGMSEHYRLPSVDRSNCGCPGLYPAFHFPDLDAAIDAAISSPENP
jgi:hypothetical protein